MNNIINLTSGTIHLKDRNFDFILPDNIEIGEGNSKILLFVTGENGAGKTTFLEQIIIPYFANQNRCYVLKGQDINIQRIADQAVNSIVSLFAPWKDMLKMIIFNQVQVSRKKISKLPPASILLMDESDKLMTDKELNEYLSDPQYRFIVMISHQLDLTKLNRCKAGFDAIYNLNIEDTGKIRKVSLKLC